MNSSDILIRILAALDTAQPASARKLTYIFDQIDSGKREDADVYYLIDTATPILKRLEA